MLTPALRATSSRGTSTPRSVKSSAAAATRRSRFRTASARIADMPFSISKLRVHSTCASKLSMTSTSSPVLVVLGAGPGLGLSVAQRFGAAGYRVALISRSPQRHSDYLAALADNGIEAAAYVADAATARSAAQRHRRGPCPVRPDRRGLLRSGRVRNGAHRRHHRSRRRAARRRRSTASYPRSTSPRSCCPRCGSAAAEDCCSPAV